MVALGSYRCLIQTLIDMHYRDARYKFRDIPIYMRCPNRHCPIRMPDTNIRYGCPIYILDTETLKIHYSG